MAQLHVPIVVDWDDIKDRLAKSDIVEVVRCANCKYLQWNMRQDGSILVGFDEYECRHWCGSCDPTDFCSYAERSEE